MSTSYPTTKQSVPNPTGTDLLDNANAQLDHDYQHATINDTVEALQDKVGINNDPNVDSFDYKLSDIASGEKAISNNGAGQTLTDITLTDPQINFGGDATGDMYYRSAGGVTTRLPIGTAGDILQVDGTLIPEWVPNPSASPATTTQAGIVELATTAETETGTDATRAVTPDGLHDMTTLAGAGWFLDEDDMVSDSAVKTVSQQSVKAYVDNNTVSTNPTSNTWFVTNMNTINGSSPSNGWTFTGTLTQYGNGCSLIGSSSQTCDTTDGIFDNVSTTTNTVVQWSDNRTMRLKFSANSVTPVSTTRNSFIGFGGGVGGNFGNITVATEYRVGFAFYNGNRYIIASNFSNITATLIDAYTSKLDQYVIQLNGTSSADFYINGVLVGSISTNLPVAAQDSGVGFAGQDSTNSTCGFNFVSNLILSQRTS